MEMYKSLERLDALMSPSNGTMSPVTVKDQEALIQELKKENFDLKLRLFMESKEFDKSIRDDKRTIGDLENEITDILQELEGSLQREREFESELDAARRREKAFINKQKRLEQALSEKDEEIKYLNKEFVKLSVGTQNESFYASEVNFKKFEEELEPEEGPNIDELKCKLFIDDGEPEQENDLNQSPEDNTKRLRGSYIGDNKNHRNRGDKFTTYGRQEPLKDKLTGKPTQPDESEETSSVDENDPRDSSFKRHRSIRSGKRSFNSKHYHENNLPNTQLKEKTYEKYREVCVDDGSSVERVLDKRSEVKDETADPSFIHLTNFTNITDISSESVPDVRLHEYRKKEKTTRHNKYLYNNGVLADSQRSRSIDDLHKNQTNKDKKKKKGKLYKMLCCLTPKLSKEDSGSLNRDYRPTPVSGQV